MSLRFSSLSLWIWSIRFVYWHMILCALVKQRWKKIKINSKPHTALKCSESPLEQHSLPLSSLSSSLFCPPPSPLRFFCKPTSTVSTPGITLQNTEEDSKCIREGEHDSYSVMSIRSTEVRYTGCSSFILFIGMKVFGSKLQWSIFLLMRRSVWVKLNFAGPPCVWGCVCVFLIYSVWIDE